ncbi:hypothetical protein GCM10027176_88250 [Actinoallomurus bryophytorum]|uniref:Uncharacterized protein n=1 Tax=Actinoallomurus bryophytorum TaxID=1490222 RepID=A0A543CMB0_9ACTN|nr:hypothetical protein FB559_3866 [Actinoallomurus bryophytorum]
MSLGEALVGAGGRLRDAPDAYSAAGKALDAARRVPDLAEVSGPCLKVPLCRVAPPG